MCIEVFAQHQLNCPRDMRPTTLQAGTNIAVAIILKGYFLFHFSYLILFVSRVIFLQRNI